MSRHYVKSFVPMPLVRSVLVESIDRYLGGYRMEPWERAEIALYLGRAEEARAAVDELDAGEFKDALEGECFLAEGRGAEARSSLEPLAQGGRFTLRALFALSTHALREMDWPRLDATARKLLALASLADEGAYAGLAHRALAIIGTQTGGDRAATENHHLRAVELLRATEDLKFRAYAESDLAGWHLAAGRAVEASVLLASVAEVYDSLALERDACIVRGQWAFADLVDGAYEQALERAREAVCAARSIAFADGEGWALHAASVAATFSGKHALAVDYAEALMSLSQFGASVVDEWEFVALTRRARARAGDVMAAAALEVAARSEQDPARRSTLSLLTADILVDVDLARAVTYHASAETTSAGPWALAEANHLTRRFAGKAARYERGRVVFDLSAGGLCRKRARALFDWYLAFESRRLTTNDDQAARLICETRNALGIFGRHAAKVLDVPSLKSRRPRGQKKRS